jgi:HD-GYP domain-containing protein (c-di-GMP phosphodiesterase class II)
VRIAKASVPYSILVSTRELKTGDVLASDCTGKGGQKVAGAGDEVDENLKNRVRNMGVRKAWVQRTLPEWMPPSEAQLFQFDVVEQHEVDPFTYQVLINFQGTFSTEGIDTLLGLLEEELEKLDRTMTETLDQIRADFDQLKSREDQLRERIQDIDDDALKSAYQQLLSSARPQSIDPSDIQGGEAATGRRIQSFLETLQSINARVTDLILRIDEEELKDMVQLQDVDDYEDTSNFLDSFVLFERLYQVPTIEEDEQVQTLFEQCHEFYRGMFYDRTLDQEQLNDITDLLWERFDPELPHWIMSLGQGGEPEGYLMAHSVNTAILTSQLYRRTDRRPDTPEEAITLTCLLMDLGMVLVPQSFHLHQNEMTEEQRKKTRIHPIISKEFYYDLTGRSDEVSELILNHHERIDGSGYPRETSELNDDLKLITVCDMFEAMSSPRMWRSAMPPAKVYKILREEASQSLDTYWVNQLIHEVGVYPVGSMVRLSNDEPAVVVEHNPDNPAKPTVVPINSLMNNESNGRVSMEDSGDLSIQAGGTSIKAPVGIRRKLTQ